MGCHLRGIWYTNKLNDGHLDEEYGYPIISVKFRDNTLEFEQVLKLMKLIKMKNSLNSIVEV